MEGCDLIVVGAGHAGCEAALAAAKMGARVLLLNMSMDTIAVMSCNPAIGGLAKGQLVREIDALGGEMGHAIDATGIHFRRLNTKKGPAVRSNRAQADKEEYRLWMTRTVTSRPGLEVRAALVDTLWVERGELKGVITDKGERIPGKAVVLTTGTFLRGMIHIGLEHYPAGRMGEPSAENLSRSLEEIGLEIGRLKTGTTPRLDSATIDYSKCRAQPSDEHPMPFSFDTDRIKQDQIDCGVTYTNERTHDIIQGGLDRSPLYTGVIEGIGPRYCPSIEDKVVRFPDRSRHHIFLEPEGRSTNLVYPNGISTSLPFDVQEAMVHSIVGLEKARILKPGYGIEYDFANPVQLTPSLEARVLPGLFLAGQINGTSGYEEAAAQGIMAGINAVRKLKGLEPVVLDRSQAYIGVMIDDLVTRGTSEPYRMFTSRAEYRLLLREDNADLRLREIGHSLGLVSAEQMKRFERKKEIIDSEFSRLETTQVVPGRSTDSILASRQSPLLKKPASLAQLLMRPELDIDFILSNWPPPEPLPPEVCEEVEIMVKYQGYIRREEDAVRRFRKMESQLIPSDLEYEEVPGLRTEAAEKLGRVRPVSLGQAMRIPGITPAAVSILQVHLRARSGSRAAGRGRTG